jgi:DinB superfamily
MDSQLTAATQRLAHGIQALTDQDLGREWTWADYEGEGLRFAGLVAYGYLRELAAVIGAERTPPTIAQRILAQYNAAYRDLQAMLIGVDDTLAEQAPAEGEWPVREVLGHIVDADAGFFVTVLSNLTRHRTGMWDGERATETEYNDLLGPEEIFMAALNQPLSGLMAYHSDLHARILSHLVDITNDEVALPARYWETQIYQLRFRLQRFDAHQRQHTIQIEKTLAALGRMPTEGSRLARLLYAALADVEAQLIGAPNINPAARTEAVEAIMELAEQVK